LGEKKISFFKMPKIVLLPKKRKGIGVAHLFQSRLVKLQTQGGCFWGVVQAYTGKGKKEKMKMSLWRL